MMHAIGLTGEVRKDALSQLEDAIRQFEELLSEAGPGSDFQAFLEDHPILLDPGYKTVIPKQQIGMGKEYETDFAIRGVGVDATQTLMDPGWDYESWLPCIRQPDRP